METRTKKLTNTSVNTLDECRYKYWLRYVLGIDPVKEADYFRIGGAYHLGQEALAKSGLDEAFAAVRKNYSVLPDWAAASETGKFDWEVEYQKVVRLLSGWAWRWNGDGIKVMRAEQVFELPIINPETGHPATTRTRGGKIDQIIQMADGRMAMREFKTCSDDVSPTSDYWKKLRMDPQVSGYFDALQNDADNEYDVITILYDVTRKPSIKPKKPVKKDVADWPMYFGEKIEDCEKPGDKESPQMYGSRLAADINERPEWYYARKEIARVDADMEDWQYDLWGKHQALLALEKRGRFPKDTRSCLLMGKCPYFDKICSAKVDASEGIPEGFKVLDNVHPELETQDANDEAPASAA